METDDEDNMDIDYNPVLQQNGSARQNGKVRWTPPESKIDPVLHEVYLPHRGLLHVTAPIRKVVVSCDLDSQAIPSKLSVVFDHGFPFLCEYKPLQPDVETLMRTVMRKVKKLPPYTIMLKRSPMQAVAPACEMQEKSRCTLPHPTGHPRRSTFFSTSLEDIPLPAELGRLNDLEQINHLKKFLSKNSSDKVNMIKLSTPVDSVFCVIRHYCAVVLPCKSCFGSRYNEKIFHRYLLLYLKLGMYDRLPVSRMIALLDLAALPWLRHSSPEGRGLVAADFFIWFFENVINSVVNRLYYVTDTTPKKNEVLFYRRELWTLMTAKTIKHHLEKKYWRPIGTAGPDSEMDWVMSFGKEQLVFYGARFLPRESGLRTVMIERSMVDVHCVHPRKAALRIRHTRVILQQLMEQYKMCGFGLGQPTDVKKAWSKFCRMRRSTQDTRPLYFVCCDVVKAYDTVNLLKLRNLVQRLYATAKKDGILCFHVYDKNFLKKHMEQSGHREELPPGRYKILTNKDKDALHRLGQLKDIKPVVISLDGLFEVIVRYAEPAVFRTPDSKWYRFQRGLPQGGRMSALFLNMYLGDVEKSQEFDPLPSELRVRWFDDMMFITPDQQRAGMFLVKMHRLPDGLSIAPHKTHTNLPNPDGGNLPVCSHQGSDVLSWYGWLFDLKHLTVKADLRRYLWFNLGYNVTIDFGHEAVTRNSIIATVNGKFSRALLDIHCGSREALLQNIYESFLICSVHLLAYWHRSERIIRRTPYVTRLMKSVTEKLAERIKQDVCCEGIQPEDLLKLIYWLAWKAYTVVLACPRGASVLGKNCRKEILKCRVKFVDELAETDKHEYRDIGNSMRYDGSDLPVEFKNFRT